MSAPRCLAEGGFRGLCRPAGVVQQLAGTGIGAKPRPQWQRVLEVSQGATLSQAQDWEQCLSTGPGACADIHAQACAHLRTLVCSGALVGPPAVHLGDAGAWLKYYLILGARACAFLVVSARGRGRCE
jgi:hypothetical protein